MNRKMFLVLVAAVFNVLILFSNCLSSHAGAHNIFISKNETEKCALARAFRYSGKSSISATF